MKTNLWILIVCSTLFFAGTSSAEIYKWVDEKGGIHFSDTPVYTDNEPVNVEVVEGTSTPGNYGITDAWFDRDDLNEKMMNVAKTFLRKHETWTEDPVFVGEPSTYVGGWSAGYVLQFRIPDNMLKDGDCTSGYQNVRVSTAINMEDDRQARITGVELDGKILYPADCSE